MTVNIAGVGKITATEQVLNLLSSLAWVTQKEYASSGYSCLSNQAGRVCDGIYEALEKNGFYTFEKIGE